MSATCIALLRESEDYYGGDTAQPTTQPAETHMPWADDQPAGEQPPL